LRGWGEREGAEWVVREGVGVGGEMIQALYAHMNNKKIFKKKKIDIMIYNK
jgi:NaMN:DMB phosphoribosyltransferase